MSQRRQRKRAKSNSPSQTSRRTLGAEKGDLKGISLKKKILFSAVATVLGLAFLEIVLAIVGVQPDRYAIDPYVGFTSNAPLFVEDNDPGSRGNLKTAHNRLHLFNLQQFPKAKSAGAYRIFSVGGSTTFGRPYDDSTSFTGWLREYLRAVAPARNWEVINAGGVSYASYRVARLMEELIRYSPDLFIVYTGHNEFLEQRIYTKAAGTPQALTGIARVARRSRAATLVKRSLAPWTRVGREEAVGESLLEGEVVTMLDDTLGPSAYTRDEALREQTLAHFQFNLGRMIDIARSVGAEIVFVTPASNLKEVSPFKSEHSRGLSQDARDQWKRLYDRARLAVSSPSPEDALVLLDQAEQIDALPASLHFVRARVFEKLGRFSEAKTAYERARDEDVCPLRALGRIQSILADVTKQHRVSLIDFVRIQEEHSENGIPGASVFLDHVHPTIESHRVLALEILKVMERKNMARPSWDPTGIQQVTQRVMEGIDAHSHAFALMNLSKVLGWAGKHQEAYRTATQAMELDSNTWTVCYQAGLSARLVSRPEEAIQHYRRAIEINPRAGNAHTSLGVLLEDQGQLQAAINHFRLALQHGAPKNRERDRRNLDAALKKVAR